MPCTALRPVVPVTSLRWSAPPRSATWGAGQADTCREAQHSAAPRCCAAAQPSVPQGGKPQRCRCASPRHLAHEKCTHPNEVVEQEERHVSNHSVQVAPAQRRKGGGDWRAPAS